MHITPADGNVFLDLGFPPEEAAALLADSIRRIEESKRQSLAVAKADSEGESLQQRIADPPTDVERRAD